MRELKLTHGGFYRHFRNKEQLVGKAICHAFEEVAERLSAVGGARKRPAALKAIIEKYLSIRHCANPAEGCPVAALASDIARYPQPVRRQFDSALKMYTKKLSKFLPGATEIDRRRNFAVLFSGMAGAISAARAVGDEKLRARILRDARSFYIQAFCG